MSTETEDLNTKADELAEKGKYKKALQLYQRTNNHGRIGDMYDKMGQPKLAARSYAEAGEYEKCGDIMASLGEFREASQHYVRAGKNVEAAAVTEKAGYLSEAAKLYSNAGEYAKAAKLYKQDGKTTPAARLLFRIDRADEAIEMLEEQNRHDLAAELCVQNELYDKAGVILSKLGEHHEAAAMYIRAGLRTNALAEYEISGSISKASDLCEEMGMLEKAGEYQEHMGNLVRAAELYHQAGRYEAAGRIFESENFLCEAAQMYEQDKNSAAKAASLFEKTFWSEKEWEFETRFQIWGIALAPKAQKIAVCLGGPEVMLLDYQGELIWRFRIPLGIRARNVDINDDGTLIIVGTEAGSIYLLDKFKKIIWKRELADQVRGLVMREEENLILAGCTDGSVYALTKDGKDLWNTRTDFKVWHIANLEGTKRIIFGCGDGTIQTLDLEGHPSRKIDAGGWVSRLAVRPDERVFAAVVGMNIVQLYSLETHEKLWEFESPETVHDVGFMRDEQLLLGTNSGMMIVDRNDGILWRHNSNDRVLRVVVTSDGSQAYLGHFDHGVSVRTFNDCQIFAARNYEKARDYEKAATLYEDKNELGSAAEMCTQFGNFQRAAELTLRLDEKERAAELFEKGGLHNEAAELYEELNLMERAAACYEASGDSSRAGQLAAKLGDSIKAAELHLQSGDFLKAGAFFRDAGANEKAIEAYEKAQERDALPADGVLTLGNLYVAVERADEAIKLLQTIIKDPELGAQAETCLAQAFMQKGLFNLAIDHYKEALRNDEEVTHENIEVWYELGCAYERAFDYQEAHATYKKILHLDYYYKDVSGRLERVNELSSVFSTAPVANPFAGDGGATNPNATMPMSQPGRYEVVKKLGEGGMGVVYMARDTKLGRDIAMKVLSESFSNNVEFKKRFMREARAVAAMNHKNVVAIYDIVEEPGQNFISMEYIEGHSLRDLQKEHRKFTFRESVDIIKQTAEGLGAAHAQGITHRDIKPENVMLKGDDLEVKVMDFGLAHVDLDEDSNITREGVVMGTLRYMAPEQVKGQKCDPPADIYSTGIMFYELIAGDLPFKTGNIGYHHMNTVPTPLVEIVPDIPRALSDIVAKCLEKEPEERFANGTELLKALEEMSWENKVDEATQVDD